MIVLDASLAGPLVIPDETGDIGSAGLDMLIAHDIHVPILWRLEVANMMRSAVRRQRMTVAERDAALTRLAALPVIVDRAGWDASWTSVVTLSDRHGLTSYDAAYLELAARLGAILATRDSSLAAAAKAENLSTSDLA